MRLGAYTFVNYKTNKTVNCLIHGYIFEIGHRQVFSQRSGL